MKLAVSFPLGQLKVLGEWGVQDEVIPDRIESKFTDLDLLSAVGVLKLLMIQ